MRRAIVIASAAFCGITFAQSVPSDHHFIWQIQWLNFACLSWIGFYAVYRSLKRPLR